MRSSAFALVVLLAASSSAWAQAVGQSGNPEVTNPAAATAPSDRRSPAEMVDKSARDLQGGHVSEALKDDVTALRRGPLLIHGNYCGVGNRPGTPPVDLLDEACMHHDACTKTGNMPSCACDNRLHDDAVAVARDPRTPVDIQVLATTMAASMVVLICK